MKRQKYQDELKIGKIKEREDMAPRDIVLNNETGKKPPELGKRKRINAIRTEIIFISSAFSEQINMYLIFSCK